MTRHTLCWRCGNATSTDTRPRLCTDCWPIVRSKERALWGAA